MKKYYVYELYNQMGTVEYVGESTNTKRRWYEHMCKNGKFHKRNDIQMHIVKEFDIRREAWDYQCQLQSEYGLETDSEKVTNIPNADTRMKMSNARKLRKPISDETREKMSESRKGCKNGMYGKTFSLEAKQKMKDAWAKRKQNTAFLKC